MTGVLVGNLRDEMMQHWTPPGGGLAGALNHVVTVSGAAEDLALLVCGRELPAGRIHGELARQGIDD